RAAPATSSRTSPTTTASSAARSRWRIAARTRTGASSSSSRPRRPRGSTASTPSSGGSRPAWTSSTRSRGSTGTAATGRASRSRSTGSSSPSQASGPDRRTWIEVERPAVVAFRRAIVGGRGDRPLRDRQPREPFGLGRVGAEVLGDEGGPLQPVAVGRGLVPNAGEVRRLVGENVHGTRDSAVLGDTALPLGEPLELGAGLLVEVGEVRRRAALVEENRPGVRRCVGEAGEEARTVDVDVPPGDLARDLGEAVLVSPLVLLVGDDYE